MIFGTIVERASLSGIVTLHLVISQKTWFEKEEGICWFARDTLVRGLN